MPFPRAGAPAPSQTLSLPPRLPPSGKGEARGPGPAARPLPHSRAGARGQRQRAAGGRPGGLRCGWTAGGEARAAPGRVLTRRGRAGSGRLPAGNTIGHSPPPRPWPRWEARRDRHTASPPPLLSPSYKYRLGPHPLPPTPGALRKVRRPRAWPRERKGDGAAQVTAVAPAVWQSPQLEAWPPATPAPPPRPALPTRLRRRPTPARGPCAPRPSQPGQARVCRAG